jgi:hypothetical protein
MSTKSDLQKDINKELKKLDKNFKAYSKKQFRTNKDAIKLEELTIELKRIDTDSMQYQLEQNKIHKKNIQKEKQEIQLKLKQFQIQLKNMHKISNSSNIKMNYNYIDSYIKCKNKRDKLLKKITGIELYEIEGLSSTLNEKINSVSDFFGIDNISLIKRLLHKSYETMILDEKRQPFYPDLSVHNLDEFIMF